MGLLTLTLLASNVLTACSSKNVEEPKDVSVSENDEATTSVSESNLVKAVLNSLSTDKIPQEALDQIASSAQITGEEAVSVNVTFHDKGDSDEQYGGLVELDTGALAALPLNYSMRKVVLGDEEIQSVINPDSSVSIIVVTCTLTKSVQDMAQNFFPTFCGEFISNDLDGGCEYDFEDTTLQGDFTCYSAKGKIKTASGNNIEAHAVAPLYDNKFYYVTIKEPVNNEAEEAMKSLIWSVNGQNYSIVSKHVGRSVSANSVSSNGD